MAKDTTGPQGLWIKCPDCREILYHREVTGNSHVCPRCNHHFRISADVRLQMLFDNGRYKKFFGKLRSSDPSGFVASTPYTEPLKGYNRKFNGSDAVVVGQGEICKIPTLVAAMEFGFMGGSMGSAVGEKLARSIDRCLDRRLPLVIVSCSGGARMQEEGQGQDDRAPAHRRGSVCGFNRRQTGLNPCALQHPDYARTLRRSRRAWNGCIAGPDKIAFFSIYISEFGIYRTINTRLCAIWW